MHRLLIVDDDKHIRTLVRTYSESEGFECEEAEDGPQALAILKEQDISLVVLDVMMPGMDGFETLTELRKFMSVPVVLLTARKEEYDKLHGFGLGADDYVPKPFSPKELMARIKAILKRGRVLDGDVLRFGGLEISESSRTVMIDGKETALTPKEFDLLLFLATHNLIVLNREQLLKNVWGYVYFGDARTVDTHIKSLRERLGDYRKLITTVWGVGYRFEHKEDR
ncbi:MAG: response regulator transcription factor [Clostridiales bacterium]|nr:response regulator transcription factor [Clostridiales bacterium]MDR2749639.1 response regulator transcription factor [Clostridiales bacterium]